MFSRSAEGCSSGSSLRSRARVTAARDRAISDVQVPTVDAEAFGLHVRLPHGLLIDALRPATTVDKRHAATVVTVEPTPIRAWAADTVERVREATHEGRVVWSVDVHPERGFKMHAAGLATIVGNNTGVG